MVDLESLERLVSANDYPHLVSQVDVDNIRSIVNAHPSLFEKSWDERGSKRRDSGAVFIREYIQDPLGVPIFEGEISDGKKNFEGKRFRVVCDAILE